MAALEILAAGAVLAAGSAATAARARAREAAAERAFPPLGRRIDVGGHSVHAVTEGTGPDLVLLHGASGSSREFTWNLMGRLAPRYRVTAFDRPGLGWSDAVPGATDPRVQADALRAAADRIGIRWPLVLGQSYGGAVALAWALADPATAGLVLVSGASMPWKGGLGAWYRIAERPLLRRMVIPLVAAFASDRRLAAIVEGIFAPDPVPPGYAEAAGTPLALRRATLLENAAQVNGLLPHVRAMSRLYPGLAMPIELVHGTADTIVPLATHAEPFSRLAPTARLSVIEGAGHMPHQSHPEAVIAAIDRAAARAGLDPALR
ncbi:alpha/beta fold hydrolase [Solirhodobacter olei]|uniref:alpha/beta fold hydrolase n=1 Tax=Solirhodobacter olei TaxID=2493082 RepID=UPI0019D4C348|nr:alpha/beta hydrolase [Solirhodobacter olei]